MTEQIKLEAEVRIDVDTVERILRAVFDDDAALAVLLAKHPEVLARAIYPFIKQALAREAVTDNA